MTAIVPADWPKAKLTSNAMVVLEKRYLKQENGVACETPEDMFYRVAGVVAGIEERFGGNEQEIAALTREFYNIMANLEFMPNSPTLMNAGRDLGQLSACFVLPVEDSMEDIFDAIKNAAIIHKSGGGTGFSFSRLRPKNSTVRTTGGVASGPVSFMKVFNAATEAVKQGGTRRGANMGILRVDHPDILEFINCKEDNQEITNFNISVAVTDQYMDAVREDRNYDLLDPNTGLVVQSLSARKVFAEIIDHAWRNGEPGVVFIDRMNAANPTPAIGMIEATNPCGEQPLLANEACNLGSINLNAVITQKEGQPVIDWDYLGKLTRLSIHFLDNVIDANIYPLDIIDKTVKGNRKVGLGIMGFADMLIQLGISYASEQAVECAEKVMQFILAEARTESQRLALERGLFPNYKGSIYDGVIELRNATLTTIAPTGTISMLCGASSGIEPHFAIAFTKTVMDGTALIEVNPLFEQLALKHGFHSPELMRRIAETGSVQGMEKVPEWVQDIFVTAQEIDPVWHVRIQAAFQKYTDNAVSKTINFANSATREDVYEAYIFAYEHGCKGITIYRDGSREEQVLTVGTSTKTDNESKLTADAEPAATPVPRTPFIPAANTILPRPRPSVTLGVNEKIKTGCGNLYVNVNADDQGICEVFTNTGKVGGCASQSEATARLVSLALRSGISTDTIIEQIQGIRCPACIRREGVNVTSCPDAIAKVIKKYRDDGIMVRSQATSNPIPGKNLGARSLPSNTQPRLAAENACPDCGSPVNHESGCVVCAQCGFSKCG